MPYDHLVRAIRRRVEATPNAVAMRHEVAGRWLPITFAELGRDVDAVASWLIAHGVGPGDRVAIFAPNSPAWTVADLAAMAAGAVPVPVYATSTRAGAEHVIRDAGTRVVFVAGVERLAALQGVRERGDVRHVVLLDDVELAPPGIHGRAEVWSHPVTPELAERAASFSPGQLATIVYTSGTTGVPKGVMLTHANLLTQFVALDTHFRVGPDDRSLSFLPLSHAYERAWTCYVLVKGAENHYLEDPKRVSEVMPVVRPTCMVSVPRLFEKVCATARHRAESGSRLQAAVFDWALRTGERFHGSRVEGRRVGVPGRAAYALADRLVLRRIRDAVGGPKSVFSAGGAALSSDVERFFFSAGLLVCQGYGLTETSPMLTCNRPGDFRFGTVGKPIPGCEIRIAEDGEILARGTNVTAGYFNRPRETAEAFEDGWFRTGDLGAFDADGFLVITGRKKELIVTSGGKNVAPTHVEGVIARDYYVEQVAAIGDGRPFLSALIVPQFEALQDWARAEGLVFDSRRALAEDERVRAFMSARIQAQQQDLPSYERIKRFTLLPERFSQAGGEITPTLKNVRPVIAAKYAAVIDAMYAGEAAGRPTP